MNKLFPSSYKAFSLALQALVLLAKHSNRCPSGDMAQKLQSEATLLRRIMASLAQHHIVETREGRDGGYRLTRPSEHIRLSEVYKALQLKESINTCMIDATGDNHFGQQMKYVISDLTDEMESSVMNTLSQYTIADLVKKSGEFDLE